MKTSKDPRHELRIETVKKLFTYDFDKSQDQGIAEIVTNLPAIDEKIREFATARPLEDISKLDLAILRNGVFELVYKHDKPAIVIDEAIEIAKEFGSDATPKFVNAILGKIAEKYESENA